MSNSSSVPPINIDDVTTLLQSQSHLWYEIGLHLGVGLSYINQQSCNPVFITRSTYYKLATVINQWLESHCSEVSWDHLIEVLKRMDLNDTAKHITSWLLTDDDAKKKYHWKMPPHKPDPKPIPVKLIRLPSEAYSNEAVTCYLSCTYSDGSEISLQHISCTVIPPPILGAQSIPCIISKSLSGGVTAGQVSVRFTPLVAGIHKLKLQVNGKDNSGLEQLIVQVGLRRKPQLITDLNRPWMTRVLDDGTIVNTECVGHCITLHSIRSERRIGLKGQGLGELYWPCGFAITAEGTLIVADNGNHRLQELTLEGSYRNHIGGKVGDGEGQFNEPKGVTIDSKTGYIYVSEIGNHRIQVFTRDFKYCNTIGSSGSAPGLFSKPYNTVFDSKGFLYVTDYGNHRIQKFTRDGRFMLEFGKKGSKPGELKYPVGITIDIEVDLLYVTERYNHRISIFTSTGQFKGCFGQKGNSQTSFNEPYGILFHNGCLYVNDCSNNRLCIY